MIKEMEYKPKYTETDILVRDFYKGYEYIVVSYGCHPCAYIALLKEQPYFNAISYEDVDVFCHGGCTYVDKGSKFKPLKYDGNYNIIGWDYAHCNDFLGSYLSLVPEFRDNSKKWTTREIIKECKEVIERLYFMEHPELNYK